MLLTPLALALAFLAPSEHHRFGLTEAMPRIEGTIRVGSYNMLNYFDQVDDPALQGKYDDFGDNPGPTSEARCEELAKVIRELDADILALQEVEGHDALVSFNEQYLQGMGYDYVVSEEVGYYRGIEQSLLSRFPVKDIRTWQNVDLRKIERLGGGWTEIPSDVEEITFQRSPLCVTVETPNGYELTLFVVHHKAGRNAWHRELETVQILEYVEDMTRDNPERNIAVIGDFNAVPWDRSTRAYFRNGMTDSMSLRSKNIEWDDTSPLRITHTSGRILDYILLNPAALEEYVIDSGFVLGSSAEEYNWREDPFPDGYASDHCAIAIDMVPRNGEGNTVTARAWPRSATKTALAASPPAAAFSSPKTTTSSSTGPTKTAAPSEAPFVASKRSKVFHTGTCGRKRVGEKNQVGYSTFSDAKNAGKRPAKCCNPTE
ncbi:MAG: endonuclease/exonuclease/phosphatase family protein [Phycisphaerales bacterium]|jgi:endonuclease/exonuclease/phosphatase family metal-dependent hydrolase|nr:endonuclease/exonuclease/phosphatase family protein [Phycisphaerales bacterium]